MTLLPWIASIGIIFIPFYELAVRLLPYASVLSPDTRVGKSAIALWFSVAIFTVAIFRGGLSSFRNKWVLAFFFYGLVSIRFMPNIPLVANGIDSSNFWVYKTQFYFTAYFLLFYAISSYSFTKEEIKKILSIMVWVALGMACYVLIQKLGIDQFFIVKQRQDILGVDNYGLVGALGQPTLVSSFLSFFVVLAFSIRKYLISAILAGTIVLVDSKVAIAAVLVSIFAYSLFTWNRVVLGIFLAFGLAVSFSVYYLEISPIEVIKKEDNGRLNTWKQTIDLWKKPFKTESSENKYTLTGFGPGSFPYFFSSSNSPFRQAHNEYIEKLLFNLGAIGLFLGVAAIISIFVSNFDGFSLSGGNDVMRFGIMSAIIAAMICAGGTFFLELGSHAFPLAILLGFLNNESIKQEG